MSGADYKLCEVCARKVFYDAEIEWDDMPAGRLVLAYCEDCAPHITVVDDRALPLLTASPEEWADDEELIAEIANWRMDGRAERTPRWHDVCAHTRSALHGLRAVLRARAAARRGGAG